MLALLIRKEIAEIIRSPKFAITFCVMAALILLAFFMGSINYRVGMEEYEAAEAESARQLGGIKLWTDAQTTVFLKPEPLHALVFGVANDIGRSARIAQYGWPRARNSRYNAETIYAVFRLIDLQFVFAIALSLFAILFAFDAVNGEKERGTLALTLSNSVPRDRLLLGKVVGTFLVLGLPLLIPVLIGSLLLPLLGVPMDGGDWLRLAMIVFGGILYIGVFLTMSVLVSALTRRSSTSFLFLLVFWIVAVLIVPRLAVMTSGKFVDVPTVDVVEEEKMAHSRQAMQKNIDAINDFWKNTNRDGMSDQDFQERWAERWRELQAEFNEDMDRFTRRVDEDRRNRERVRERLSLAISRVSPAAVFGLAASNLAGTSVRLKNRFDDGVREYHATFTRFVLSKSRDVDASVWMSGKRDGLPDIDPREMPRFGLEDVQVRDQINEALPDLALLLMMNLVFFLGAVLAFRRYDVRQ